jgi:hypothetical protein
MAGVCGVQPPPGRTRVRSYGRLGSPSVAGEHHPPGGMRLPASANTTQLRTLQPLTPTTTTSPPPPFNLVTQMTSKGHAMHTCAHDKTSRPLRPFGASLWRLASAGCSVPVWLQQPGGAMKDDGNPLTLTALAGRGDLIPRLFNVVRTRFPAVGRRVSTPRLV